MTTAHESRVLHYQGHTVACRDHETALDALLRAGAGISFSCKSGVCHRCMVRCIDGEVPDAARTRLPEHLQEAGYLLACQCRPQGPMVLAPRSAADSLTRCQLLSVQPTEAGRWRLRFAPLQNLSYRAGYLAGLVGPEPSEERLAVFLPATDDPETAEVELEGALPGWLDATAGDLEFRLRGPLPVEPETPVQPLPTDPALWDDIGGDTVVRAVLTTFYDKVFADPQLRPFFARVTQDRIIGKQFSFLKENIQGIPVFLGEQPRNSHHWMVISDALFDHRQNLMLQAMREHGLPDALIARWSRHEEHFRPEIVKYKAWPKRIGDLEVDTEQYEECELDDATVCDYCGDEIPARTRVRFHKRLGQVGCATCAPAVPA